MVRNHNRLATFVHRYADFFVGQFALVVTLCGHGGHFLRRVDGVCHNLAQENLVVRIKELLDYGEDVLTCNTNFTCLHSFMFLVMNFNFMRRMGCQTACHASFSADLTLLQSGH